MAVANLRDHEFEKDQGAIYGRVWRETNGMENDVIIISKKCLYKTFFLFFYLFYLTIIISKVCVPFLHQ